VGGAKSRCDPGVLANYTFPFQFSEFEIQEESQFQAGDIQLHFPRSS
jgi:hypothetical protein